jgi:hypothetical protein
MVRRLGSIEHELAIQNDTSLAVAASRLPQTRARVAVR